jgi:hypothetical protein
MDTHVSGPLPWTPMEFEDLLHGVIKDSPAPGGLRPGRWPRDVTQLWNAIHHHHTQPESSTLSPMMRHRLAALRGHVQCAVCQTTF